VRIRLQQIRAVNTLGDLTAGPCDLDLVTIAYAGNVAPAKVSVPLVAEPGEKIFAVTYAVPNL
jgi:hypothetical protein